MEQRLPAPAACLINRYLMSAYQGLQAGCPGGWCVDGGKGYKDGDLQYRYCFIVLVFISLTGLLGCSWKCGKAQPSG